LSYELQQRFFERSTASLYNLYGPTEASIDVAAWQCRDDSNLTVVPVGQPIANTQLYILDPHLKPVPIGVAGELHIGGDGLARGYLNRPELTAEKFIANPFSQEPGARLYKTGDLARYLPDGNIEFLGRIDNQVKIRGYRIELGEIEAVLAQHPSVQQTAVLAREDTPGDKRLAAYCVAAADSTPLPHDLRSFLQEKLPDYMVPSAFVFLDSLPLTPNGKLDRKALPTPTDGSLAVAHRHIPPRDELEITLCRLWAETLGVEKVGIDDDFFALGGHSLLAAKLFTRMDEALGRSLPLGVLFAAPNIRALAQRYGASGSGKIRSLVSLRSSGQLPPIFAVPGVYGNVLGFADLARELGPEQPFYGLQSLGLDGMEAPLNSIESMASLYIEELRSVRPAGPYALVGACFGATVAFEMTHQLLRIGEDVAFLGLLDPTGREGQNSNGENVASPRALIRLIALGDLIAGRLNLYLEELSQLSTKARLKFVATKLRSVGASLTKRNRLKGVQRELNQIAVYNANLQALDHYQKAPIAGNLRKLEIFETGRGVRSRAAKNSSWATLWPGPISFHTVPGKDSGDMISGNNARDLARLLSRRLRAAFNRE
jgi:thioesterase domain-containing protein